MASRAVLPTLSVTPGRNPTETTQSTAGGSGSCPAAASSVTPIESPLVSTFTWA